MAWMGIGAANFVSIVRMFMSFGVVYMLYIQDANIYTWAFFLTIAVIWMDGLDGYLARKLNESSPAGALIDILSDRVVEQVFWIAFAVFGWIPLWIPLVIIMRGVWVDGLRGLGAAQGLTAFGSSSMMKTWWGVLLVSSRFSRWTYAACKAIAFSFIILAHQPIGGWATELVWVEPLAMWTVYISVGFCVIRGLPVLIESRRFL